MKSHSIGSWPRATRERALIDAKAEHKSAAAARLQAERPLTAMRRAGSKALEDLLLRVAALPDEVLPVAQAQCDDAIELYARNMREAAQAQEESLTRQRAAAAEAERLTALGQRLDNALAPLREEPGLRVIFLLPPPDAALVVLAEVQGQLDQGVAGLQREGLQVQRAQESAAEAARALAAFAARPEQAVLEQTLRDRLSEPDLEVLLNRVPAYVDEVELRAQAVRNKLLEVDEHRKLLSTSLLRVTDPALRLLRSLERGSVFPAWVAGWGGLPFLKVTLRIPETSAEREAVAATLIDQIVQSAEVPSGLRLIQRLVRELTRGEGLSVQVVKPEAVRRQAQYEPIERLRSFSRGEQLTAALLLYCTLARLRAQGRAGRKQATTQVLILDNPIGTCSKPELVALQRDMAAAHGVQLIYTTGVEDLEALARLPNTIRLQNVHADLRGRLHVKHAEPPTLQTARVARSETRVVSS